MLPAEEIEVERLFGHGEVVGREANVVEHLDHIAAVGGKGLGYGPVACGAVVAHLPRESLKQQAVAHAGRIYVDGLCHRVVGRVGIGGGTVDRRDAKLEVKVAGLVGRIFAQVEVERLARGYVQPGERAHQRLRQC